MMMIGLERLWTDDALGCQPTSDQHPRGGRLASERSTDRLSHPERAPVNGDGAAAAHEPSGEPRGDPAEQAKGGTSAKPSARTRWRQATAKVKAMNLFAVTSQVNAFVEDATALEVEIAREKDGLSVEPFRWKPLINHVAGHIASQRLVHAASEREAAAVRDVTVRLFAHISAVEWREPRAAAADLSPAELILRDIEAASKRATGIDERENGSGFGGGSGGGGGGGGGRDGDGDGDGRGRRAESQGGSRLAVLLRDEIVKCQTASAYPSSVGF